MKHLLKKLLKASIRMVFFLPLWLNGKVKSTNWYLNVIPSKGNYPDNDWYREHDERNFDIINLGSSSAVYAFDYSTLDVKAFNWALQPQSMEYGFKVLKNYFSILRQNGIVIIPFSPFSGLSVTGKWTETANDKYFHILDHSLIDDYENVRRRRMYPLFYQPKQSLKRLLKDVPKKAAINCSILCHTESEFEADAERWVNNWKKEFNISDLDAPMSEENRQGACMRKETVQNLISFCKERDLRPVLVIPPMHPSLSSRLTPAFRNAYIYEFIRSINVENIPVMDYIDSQEFIDNKYFRNAFFMSDEGAKRFTAILIRRLKKNGVMC